MEEGLGTTVGGDKSGEEEEREKLLLPAIPLRSLSLCGNATMIRYDLL